MNNKQTFYRLEKLNDTMPDANYRILLGERSNGKSYAVKERGAINAWNSINDKFMFFRRWGLEVKASYVEQYFKDLPITAITKNECNSINCTGGKIFLARYNTESKVKVTNVAHIAIYAVNNILYHKILMMYQWAFLKNSYHVIIICQTNRKN